MATPTLDQRPLIEFRPGLDSVRASLRKRIEQLSDRSVPNRRIAVRLDRWVQQNFRSEGAAVGGWTPFKLGGRRIKGKGIDKSAKLLQNTGLLRASFHSFWDKDTVGIGSDLSYSIYHEQGSLAQGDPTFGLGGGLESLIKAGSLPQRRMLPRQEDIEEIGIISVYNDFFGIKSKEPLW